MIIGRNERIVWGVAVLPADTQDLFVEQVDPHDPTRYLVENGGTLPFDTRDESIPIAGRAPVHVRSRATRHGPVLYEDDARPLALRAVALDPDDTSLDGYFALQHARDFESFRAALGHLTSPSLSFVYADVEGHIGYVAAGRVPRRDAREGWLALDGPTAGAAWPAGYLTAAEMPTVFDPPEGFLVAANNRVGSSGPAAALAAEWSAPYRAARLRELIATHARLTPDGAADLQADVDDAVARALVPTLRALVPRDARERTVEDLLAHWNLRADGASAAAAVFVAWRSRLLRAMVEDELTGETLDAYLAIASGEVLVDAVTDPHAVLCDDVRTPARESCTDLARATFAPTLDALVAAQGSDPGRWRLDHLQAIDLDSAIFDTIPLLGSHFARHVGVGGDAETVRVSGAPFFSSQVVTASALFAVMEAAPGVAPRFALLGGESGHPLGTHARDQLDAWTHNVPFAIAGDGSSGTVVLVPAR